MRDLLVDGGLPCRPAQDLVRNPLLEAEAPQPKDEKPSALQKMAALQKRKAELGKGQPGNRRRVKTTENPIRGVRRPGQARGVAREERRQGSSRRLTDDEGPRDLLTEDRE